MMNCISKELQLPAARLPELVSKFERLDCFHWFFSEHRRENQSKLSTDHSLPDR